MLEIDEGWSRHACPVATGRGSSNPKKSAVSLVRRLTTNSSGRPGLRSRSRA